jgi:hypothetical protein
LNALSTVAPEGLDHRNIACIAPSGDWQPADAPLVVARIKCLPTAAQINLRGHRRGHQLDPHLE